MASESLKLRVWIAGDNVVSHAGDIIGGDKPRLYRVGPDRPQYEANEDDGLPAEEDQQEPRECLIDYIPHRIAPTKRDVAYSQQSQIESRNETHRPWSYRLRSRSMARMEDVSAILAQNIKGARKLLGWSQEELADRAKIDRTYVSGIERQVRNPTITVVARFAQALGTTTADLLTDRAG